MPTSPTPPTFALAGEIVSTSTHARRILVDAIKTGKQYLELQAESVLTQLRRHEAKLLHVAQQQPADPMLSILMGA